MEVSITGLKQANANYVEYASENLLNTFTNLISPLNTIFQKAPANIISADYDQLVNQLNLIQQFAQNGVKEPDGSTSYMNADMVTSLNSIMGSLSIVGFPPVSQSPLTNEQKQEAVVLWQQLQNLGFDISASLSKALNIIVDANRVTYSLTNYLTNETTQVASSVNPNATLQGMIQIEYLGLGNNMISNNLASLESSLSTTQSIVNTLGALQNISNQLAVKAPSGFAFPPPLDGNLSPEVAAQMLMQKPSSSIGRNIYYQGFLASALVQRVGFNVNNKGFADMLRDAYFNGTASARAEINNAVVKANTGPIPFSSSPPYPENDAQLSPEFMKAMVSLDPNFGVALINDYLNTTGSSYVPPAPISLMKLIIYQYTFQVVPNTANPDNATIDPTSMVNDINHLSSTYPDVYYQGYVLGTQAPRNLRLNVFNQFYKDYASAYFSQIFPTTTAGTAAAQSLFSVKSALTNQYNILMTQNSTLPKRSDTISALATSLKKVIDDINTAFNGISNPQTPSGILAAKKWILDGYLNTNIDKSIFGERGAIQNRLQAAISNAENLNENQREAVQSYLFVFQNFYQSAAGILQLIGTIFQYLNKHIKKR